MTGVCNMRYTVQYDIMRLLKPEVNKMQNTLCICYNMYNVHDDDNASCLQKKILLDKWCSYDNQSKLLVR